MTIKNLIEAAVSFDRVTIYCVKYEGEHNFNLNFVGSYDISGSPNVFYKTIPKELLKQKVYFFDVNNYDKSLIVSYRRDNSLKMLF